MPALDPSGDRVGAYHIADQNKHNPIKTLCGQALDKPSISYWTAPENFEHATCKVCLGIYFDKDWSGNPNIQKEELIEPEMMILRGVTDPPIVNIFANLVPPINDHGDNNGQEPE